MSQSTRFIMVAIGGWIGLRAVSLGLIPGGEANAIDRSARASPSLPPVAATLFAPIEPVAPPAPLYAPGAAYPLPYAMPVHAAGVSQARYIYPPGKAPRRRPAVGVPRKPRVSAWRRLRRATRAPRRSSNGPSTRSPADRARQRRRARKPPPS